MEQGTGWSKAIASESIIDTKLTHAKELQNRIDLLREEQNRILAPIIAQAMKDDDPTYTMALIKKLPRGFHRTQLRRHHIKRVENSEYTRRSPT